MDGYDRLCASCWGYERIVALPALLCLMGETEELDREGEMRGQRDTPGGGMACEKARRHEAV